MVERLLSNLFLVDKQRRELFEESEQYKECTALKPNQASREITPLNILFLLNEVTLNHFQYPHCQVGDGLAKVYSGGLVEAFKRIQQPPHFLVVLLDNQLLYIVVSYFL